MRKHLPVKELIGREWFSAAELAGLPGLPGTERGVLGLATRENWTSRKRPRGKGRDYYRSSLPRETREYLARLELEAAPPVVIDGVLRRTSLYRESAPVPVTGLAPRKEARAGARLAILAAVEDYARSSGLSWRQAVFSFCQAYGAGQVMADHPGRTFVRHLDPATVYRWRATLQAQGAGALGGRYKQSRHSRVDAVPEVRDFVLGMLRDHPHVPAALLIRGLKARFVAAVIPSKRALQRWVAAWKTDNAQLFLAIKNPDAWRSKYRASGGDASEGVERLNQRWELDSTPADLILADGQRHAIIGVIDVYSRRLKLHVSRTSRGTAIAALVRRALLDWGVPETAVTDNGQDYVSLYLRAAWQDLGIQHVVCPPFSPEKKPFIERALGRFSHDLVELLPGYAGHSVAQRKDIEARKSFAQRLTRGGGEPLILNGISAEQLQGICDQWADNVYARAEHQGLGGKTPFELATEWTGARQRIRDERALDVLLAQLAGERVIGKKGVRVDGGIYDAPELGGREGERVIVRLDEGDCGRAYLFGARDGAFLCVAQDADRTGVSRRDLAIARRQRQTTVVNAGKAAVKAAAKRARTAGIYQEILDASAADAGRVVALPGRSQTYLTDALQAAADAAAAHGDTPTQPRLSIPGTGTPTPTPADIEFEAALARSSAEQAAKRTRYQAACRMEAQPVLRPEDALWLEHYQHSSEYRSLRLLEEADEEFQRASGGT